MRRPEKRYYVYLMTNKSRRLYTGVTSEIERRVHEHKHKLVEGFTKKYNITRLVYYEVFQDIRDAIRREKQVKGWLRTKAFFLVRSTNPAWRDLSEGCFQPAPLSNHEILRPPRRTQNDGSP